MQEKLAQMKVDAQRKQELNLASQMHSEQLSQSKELERTIVNAFTVLMKYLDGKTTKTEVVNQLQSIATPDVEKLIPALHKLDESIVQSRVDLSPLKEVLTEISSGIKSLPTTFPEAPEQKETVKVDNLDQIDTQSIVEAINALDLKVEYRPAEIKVAAPKIPTPVVNVPQISLDPVKELFSQLLKAIEANKPLPDDPVDLTKLEKEQKKQTEYLRLIREKPSYMGGDVSFQDSTGKPVRANVDANGNVIVTIKPTDSYALSDIDDSTSTEYYGYEDKDGNWYIKKFLSNSFTFAKGTTSYSTAWTNRSTQTYASYGSTF